MFAPLELHRKVPGPVAAQIRQALRDAVRVLRGHPDERQLRHSAVPGAADAYDAAAVGRQLGVGDHVGDGHLGQSGVHGGDDGPPCRQAAHVPGGDGRIDGVRLRTE